jgi:hypothetical protein
MIALLQHREMDGPASAPSLVRVELNILVENHILRSYVLRLVVENEGFRDYDLLV